MVLVRVSLSSLWWLYSGSSQQIQENKTEGRNDEQMRKVPVRSAHFVVDLFPHIFEGATVRAGVGILSCACYSQRTSNC